MRKFATVLALAAFATAASAQSAPAPVDVAALVANISSQIGPITLVGGAVLLVFVAVKAFRWVRAAMA